MLKDACVQTDPCVSNSEYNAYVMQKYHSDSSFRERRIQSAYKYTKERCQVDPEFAQKRRDITRQRNNERYHNDPAYRELRLQKQREYYAKRKEKSEIPPVS
jgi:hypothetical protein